MPHSLDLILTVLAALTDVGAAGVVVSFALDALRARFPLPAPDAPAPTGVHAIVLRLVWTPVTAFLLAVLVSMAAGASVAALRGEDVFQALDTAVANAFASQVTWFVRWLALDPQRRRLPERCPELVEGPR